MALTNVVFAADREQLSKDALNTFIHGAKFKETIQVVDSVGIPISNATVKVGLEQGASGKVKVYSGITDTNGCWTVEGYCSRYANYRIKKNGHYETYRERKLFSADYASVNDRIKSGRWQPWNPTVQIVLKEKHNPIPLARPQAWQRVFPFDTSVGFDFEEGDLVTPFGKGKTTDVIFKIVSKIQADENIRRADHLELSFNSDDDGVVKLIQDTDSQMKSVYTAPSNGFDRVSTYQRNRELRGSGNMYDMALNSDEYLVFRIRVEKNSEGVIVKSHYGKIYTLKFGDVRMDEINGYVTVNYFLNTVNNDNNLEWNGFDLTTKKSRNIIKYIGPF